jgi:catechol 1,2-dioxygenase
MKRRTFVKNTSLIAASIAVFGKIKWVDGKPIGDSATTTDILGPFYRPGSPFRTNINPKNFSGIPLHLSGTIYKDDGKTTFKNCMIEIWQCNPKGEYDNLSDDFIYRGAAKTGADGKYHFITTHPVAYLADKKNNIYRPAHIHMRITGAQGERDLITQIYFKGDSHLAEDEYSNSPKALNRILETTKNSKGEEVVQFDIVMSKEFPLDDVTFKRLCGIYDANDGNRAEFYHKGDLLFVKWNGQIEDAAYYTGNNSFENGSDSKVKFELLENGKVKATISLLENGEWKTSEATKLLSY